MAAPLLGDLLNASLADVCHMQPNPFQTVSCLASSARHQVPPHSLPLCMPMLLLQMSRYAKTLDLFGGLKRYHQDQHGNNEYGWLQIIWSAGLCILC